MNVLITGAFGWLGKGLTEVVNRRHTITAFELETSDAPLEAMDFDGRVIHGDVSDFEEGAATSQDRNRRARHLTRHCS